MATTEATYRTILLDCLAAVGETLNAELVADGLDPLVDWLPGEPLPIREDNTPYAWYTWAPYSGVPQPDLSSYVEHEVEFLVTLGLAGSDGGDLARKYSQYGPRIIAAVENMACPYPLAVVAEGFIASPKQPFALFPIGFVANVTRNVGGLS